MAAPSYCPRFGFRLAPFGKGSPSVETPNSAEVALQMDYLLETKGVGVVTGPAGVGKTTALASYLRRLSPMRYRVVYVCLTTVTPTGFLFALSSALGIGREYTKAALFSSIKAQMAQLHDGKGVVPVVVVDEASHLGSAVLGDLKMLLNFDMDSANKAALVLCGLERLQGMLAAPQNEPLLQRVSSNVRLRPLTQEEARAYVAAKCQAAGGSAGFLADGALQAAVNAAKGLPRMLDSILGKACMLANVAGLDAVTPEVVRDAVSSL